MLLPHPISWLLFIYVPIQTELDVMDWNYLGTPSHKVRCTQQHTFIKWSKCVWDWAQAAPEAEESYMSRWLMHTACFLLAHHHPTINPHF